MPRTTSQKKKTYILIATTAGRSSLLRQFTDWTLADVEGYVVDYCTGPDVAYTICEVKTCMKGK